MRGRGEAPSPVESVWPKSQRPEAAGSKSGKRAQMWSRRVVSAKSEVFQTLKKEEDKEEEEKEEEEKEKKEEKEQEEEKEKGE